MRRFSFLLITMSIVMAMVFNTVEAKKITTKNKTNKRMENVVSDKDKKGDKKDDKKDKDDEKSTLEKYRERAAKGDAEAMLLLGKAYYHGTDGAKVNYEKAAKWFFDAAEIKDTSAAKWSAEAKGWLGLLYYSGKGVDQDKERAMQLFIRATKGGFTELVTTFEDMAKDGDPFACKFMSECYDKGVGVKRNTDTAAEYTRMAADAGDKDSYMPTAMYLYNNGKKGESFKYFEKIAKDNYKAAYFCGLMLYDGEIGVDQDKVRGMKYLQNAADEGHVAANLKLGECYLYGNGVGVDKEKGAQMIKVAAEKGNNKAMWILANLYRLGEGITQSYPLAAQWMSQVALGNKGTDYNKLIAELKGRNDPFYTYLQGLYEYNITGNYDEAMNLFKAVEKAKVVDGKTMQGVVFTNKNYKKHDKKKAAKLFDKASKDSPLACYYLSFLKESGDGDVKKDEKAALELLTKAADGGCAQAQCRLGDKYLKGNGVGMDMEKAAKYYLLAEAQHSLTPESAKNLAKLYENELPYMPQVDDLKKHVENLKKTKESNALVNMLASTFGTKSK